MAEKRALSSRGGDGRDVVQGVRLAIWAKTSPLYRVIGSGRVLFWEDVFIWMKTRAGMRCLVLYHIERGRWYVKRGQFA